MRAQCGGNRYASRNRSVSLPRNYKMYKRAGSGMLRKRQPHQAAARFVMIQSTTRQGSSLPGFLLKKRLTGSLPIETVGAVSYFLIGFHSSSSGSQYMELSLLVRIFFLDPSACSL